MEEDKPRVIGGCPGCRRSAVLVSGACGSCSALFGPKFGALASKVRESPSFRKACYDALKTDVSRTRFVEMFGPVDHGIRSTTLSQGCR